MAAVRTLLQLHVSPSPSLPSQSAQALSFLDLIWLQGFQVERLFFYEFPYSVSHFIDRHLPTLTTSLSLALRHFYLVAGTIRFSSNTDSDDGQYEIVYTEGDSVTLTIAEITGENFDQISGYNPRSLSKLRLLLPKPVKSQSDDQFPPMSIQITIFPNQGLCVGFLSNHAAFDGSGSLQFIRSWANACSSTDGIVAPIIDRSIIIDSRGIGAHFIKRADLKKAEKQDAQQSSVLNPVFATFTLAKKQIERLKERAKNKRIEEGKSSFHNSTFVVACAYTWSCLAKTRGYVGNTKHIFACAVDWRCRMRPPIPSNYFGNCLGGLLAQLEGGELVGKDGVEKAAIMIGMSIDELQGRDIFELFEDFGVKFPDLAKSKPLSVAGSPKLRVYEVDFGWGKPAKVDVTSIFETGAMSLAESRDGRGGVEIAFALSEEEMNKFGDNFRTGLQHLL